AFNRFKLFINFVNELGSSINLKIAESYLLLSVYIVSKSRISNIGCAVFPVLTKDLISKLLIVICEDSLSFVYYLSNTFFFINFYIFIFDFYSFYYIL